MLPWVSKVAPTGLRELVGPLMIKEIPPLLILLPSMTVLGSPMAARGRVTGAFLVQFIIRYMIYIRMAVVTCPCRTRNYLTPSSTTTIRLGMVVDWMATIFLLPLPPLVLLAVRPSGLPRVPVQRTRHRIHARPVVSKSKAVGRLRKPGQGGLVADLANKGDSPQSRPLHPLRAMPSDRFGWTRHPGSTCRISSPRLLRLAACKLSVTVRLITVSLVPLVKPLMETACGTRSAWGTGSEGHTTATRSLGPTIMSSGRFSRTIRPELISDEGCLSSRAPVRPLALLRGWTRFASVCWVVPVSQLPTRPWGRT